MSTLLSTTALPADPSPALSRTSDNPLLRCPACQYDLNHLASDVCPECGTSFDRAALLNPPKRETVPNPRIYLPAVAMLSLILWREKFGYLSHEVIGGIGPTIFAALWLTRRNASRVPDRVGLFIGAIWVTHHVLRSFPHDRPGATWAAPTPFWAFAVFFAIIFLVRRLFDRTTGLPARTLFIAFGLPPALMGGHFLLYSTGYFTDSHYWSDWNTPITPSGGGGPLPYGWFPWLFLIALGFGLLVMYLCTLIPADDEPEHPAEDPV